jgi:ABC-type nitrate/sulfonate/bicarbonate transport system substrate-binding protein
MVELFFHHQHERKKMQLLRDVLRSALIITVCASLFKPAELAAQTKKIVFGYSTVGAMAAGSWMAKEIGAYEKYGIDAEMIYISSGPTTVQALLGGDIVGGIAATNAVIAAVLRGAPLVSVLSTANRPYHRFWVQPEITRIEDLKGKTIGVTRSRNTAWRTPSVCVRWAAPLKSARHFKTSRSPAPSLPASVLMPVCSPGYYSSSKTWAFSIRWMSLPIRGTI